MSKSSAAITLATLLIAFVAVGMSSAAEPVLLQYKFNEGERLRYTLEMRNKTSYALPDGTKEQQAMTYSMDLSQELIEKKKDGSYQVAVTIDKATQTVDGQVRPVPPQPGPQIINMLPNGQIAGGVGPNPGAAGQMQMIFPVEAIKEGETWEQSGRIAQPLPLETLTKYTLLKSATAFPGHGDAALIKSAMSIDSPKGEGGEQVSSSTRGNLWFDVKNGRMLRSKASSTFKFNLPIQVPGMPKAQNVRVDLELDLDIKLTGTK